MGLKTVIIKKGKRQECLSQKRQQRGGLQAFQRWSDYLKSPWDIGQAITKESTSTEWWLKLKYTEPVAKRRRRSLTLSNPVPTTGGSGGSPAALSQQHNGKTNWFWDGRPMKVFSRSKHGSIWNLPNTFLPYNNGYGIPVISKMTNVEHIKRSQWNSGMFIEDGRMDALLIKELHYVRVYGPVLIVRLSLVWQPNNWTGKYQMEEVELWKQKIQLKIPITYWWPLCAKNSRTSVNSYSFC